MHTPKLKLNSSNKPNRLSKLTMATRVLLFPFCKPLGLTTTLTACTILAVPLILQPHRSLLTYRLDTLSQPLNASSPQYNSLSTDRRRKPINPRIVRQITVGSVIGALAILFRFLLFIIVWAEWGEGFG